MSFPAKKVFSAFILCALSCAASPYCNAQDAPIVLSVPEEPARLYEKFEIRSEIGTAFKNPYDAGDIDVSAEITTPDGKRKTLPAFYSGAGNAWTIRYSPLAEGKHSVLVKFRASSGAAGSATGEFSAVKSASPGFIRRSPYNPYYLVFDSGRSFFGIGHNVAWVTENNIEVFDSYFEDLAAAGCNMTRIWVNSPWTFAVETEKVCVYNSHDLGAIDKLLGSAKKHGIYVVLVLDTYGSLKEEPGDWNEGIWHKNPYNAANGGPCAKPWDFFTDEGAKQIYKNRLRYLVARFSYSSNIIAFELWNELNTPTEWLGEMSSYIKSINPHGQFITASLGYPWDKIVDESEFWALPDVDLVQHHIWGENSGDITGHLLSLNAEFRKLRKPFFTGEFAMSSLQDDKYTDPEGSAAGIHTSIWASAMSGSFSSALNWWWAGYIKAKDLYHHYQGLSKFVAGCGWNAKKVSFFRADCLRDDMLPGEEVFSDVTVLAAKKWGPTEYTGFRIEHNGDVSGGELNYYLQGIHHRHLKENPLFITDFQRDGKAIIHVDKVCQGGKLMAFLDGNEVLSGNFPAGEGKGPWKKSFYRKEFGVYQCDYDTDVVIDIPKGRHELRLTNIGADWIGIKSVTFAGYRSNRYADARCLGVKLDEEILLWVQNKGYNWKDVTGGKDIQAVKNAFIEIQAEKDSSYEIEWWDTLTGDVTGKNIIRSAGKKLRIPLPEIQRDIACKIREQ